MVKRATHNQNTRSARRVRNVGSIGIGVTVVAIAVVGGALFAGRTDQHRTQAARADTRVESVGGLDVLPVVDVYKSPTCGCCSKWVEHLRDHGFTVRATDTTDLATVKARHGVPRQLESCHTAVVEGYVIEGHVPAADIQRLLKDRPAIAGLAVAGMPTGSPGMEVPGVKPQQYDVVSFATDGSTRVFATHN